MTALSTALRHIAELAHDKSTGPAVPDTLWEIRNLAYDALLEHADIPDTSLFIVSVVLLKDTPTGFNTQNRLYPVHAINQEEAHGKALSQISVDYPEHRLHTLCSYQLPTNALTPVQTDAENLLFALHAAWPYVHQHCTINSVKNSIVTLMRKHGDFADLHADTYLTKAQVVSFLEALHKDANGQHNHYAYAARRIREEL